MYFFCLLRIRFNVLESIIICFIGQIMQRIYSYYFYTYSYYFRTLLQEIIRIYVFFRIRIYVANFFFLPDNFLSPIFGNFIATILFFFSSHFWQFHCHKSIFLLFFLLGCQFLFFPPPFSACQNS